MPQTMTQDRRAALLTTLENRKPDQAKATLTARETAARDLRRAVRRSDVKLADIGDHGQISRQIDDKENLSFHHMYALWPREVWIELIPILAARWGYQVERVLRFKESA